MCIAYTGKQTNCEKCVKYPTPFPPLVVRAGGGGVQGGSHRHYKRLVLEVTSPAWKISSLLLPLHCSKHKSGVYLCYRWSLSKAGPGSGGGTRACPGSASAERQLQCSGPVSAPPCVQGAHYGYSGAVSVSAHCCNCSPDSSCLDGVTEGDGHPPSCWRTR